MRTVLHDHQVAAIDMLRASLGRGNKRPMLQAPTGMGKTVVAASIIERALAKGHDALFVVPAISLIDQTVQAFGREGIHDIGVIQADHPMTDASRRVQIASVQTLRRRELPKVGIVIIDEAHQWFKDFGTWFRCPKWHDVPIIGLSATPWTRGLGKHFDDLIVATTTAELIEKGYLSRFRVFAPSHPDLAGVRTVAGDFHEGDLGAAMNKIPLIADIVETWIKRGEQRPTLCFGVDRAHAKHLQQSFLQAGVDAGYMDSYTEREEREEIRRQFQAGEIKVVSNVGVLTTGVDWDVRCIVLARPTRSEKLFVQIVGRGLRTAPGKDDCLILDHSDNHLRLGFVTDIGHDKLDDGSNLDRKDREKKPPLPKECPKCAFLKPPKVHVCPACGFEPEHKAAVDWQDGELIEISGKGSAAKSKEASKATKQLWWSGFLDIAQQRGYKSGWAANHYRNRFGVWPRGLTDIPSEPTPEIRSYVTASMIRFAKSQKPVGEDRPHG